MFRFIVKSINNKKLSKSTLFDNFFILDSVVDIPSNADKTWLGSFRSSLPPPPVLSSVSQISLQSLRNRLARVFPGVRTLPRLPLLRQSPVPVFSEYWSVHFRYKRTVSAEQGQL